MSELKNSNKRFGTIAVENGFINPHQMTEALAIQAQENVKQSYHRKIGVILIDLGYMSTNQVRHVLVQLRRHTGLDA